MVFIIDPNIVLGPKPCPLFVPIPCSTKCGIKPLYGVPLYGVEV